MTVTYDNNQSEERILNLEPESIKSNDETTNKVINMIFFLYK